MEASKLNLKIENTDGTYTDLNVVLPRAIAEELLAYAMRWEVDYLFTFKDIKKYNKEVDKLKKTRPELFKL